MAFTAMIYCINDAECWSTLTYNPCFIECLLFSIMVQRASINVLFFQNETLFCLIRFIL